MMTRVLSYSMLVASVLAGGKKGYGGGKKQYKAKKVQKKVVVEPIILETDVSRGEPTICCPEGFELSGRECVAQHFVPAALRCPIGVLRGDICETTAPALAECPVGFRRMGGECVQNVHEDASCFCPDGFWTENGRCVAHEPVALVPFCESGELREALCHFLEHHIFEEVCYCPEGFIEEHGKCINMEVFDCTGDFVAIQAAPARAYGGYSYGGKKGGKKGLRYLGGKKGGYKVSKKAGVAYMSVPCAEEEDCIEKTSVIQQTCEKKTICDLIVERHCPPGTIEENGRCVLRHHLPALMTCPAMGDRNDCYRLRHAPLMWECPHGFRKTGQTCVSTINAPLEHYCPPESTMINGRCVCHHEAAHYCREGVLADDMCCIVETAPPTVSYVTTCVGSGCVPEPIQAELELCNGALDVIDCVVRTEERHGCYWDDFGNRHC